MMTILPIILSIVNYFEMLTLGLFKSEDFDALTKFHDSLSFQSNKVGRSAMKCEMYVISSSISAPPGKDLRAVLSGPA